MNTKPPLLAEKWCYWPALLMVVLVSSFAMTTAYATDATAVVGTYTTPAAGTVATGSTSGTFLDLSQGA